MPKVFEDKYTNRINLKVSDKLKVDMFSVAKQSGLKTSDILRVIYEVTKQSILDSTKDVNERVKTAVKDGTKITDSFRASLYEEELEKRLNQRLNHESVKRRKK